MSVKDTVRKQLRKQIERAASRAAIDLYTPSEGWIATMRGALGMSGAQLGKRLGLSRGRIAQAEKAENDGGVTLRSMNEMAEAMGARFVYAIIPEGGSVDEIIKEQALKKATKLVGRVSTHMALEKQALGDEKNQEEIERIAAELIRKLPSDFWVDE